MESLPASWPSLQPLSQGTKLSWIPADPGLTQGSPIRCLILPQLELADLLIRCRRQCGVWFPSLPLMWKPSPKCCPGFHHFAVYDRFTRTRMDHIVLCHATSGSGLLPPTRDHARWHTSITRPTTSKCPPSWSLLNFCTSGGHVCYPVWLRVHFLHCTSPWRQSLGLPWGKPSTHSVWDTRSL